MASSRQAPRHRRLASAKLYVLLDGGESRRDLQRLAGSLIRAGVDILQLRDKRLPDRELLERARTLRKITRAGNTLLIVNDRPDLALLAEADGVHVGQDELTIRDVRALAGTNLLVGVSTHSLKQALAAESQGADYIGCGPVFPSKTKSFRRFPGLRLLRAVAKQVRIPAFAIGGIGPDNLPAVLDAGVRRVAVAHAVAGAADPPAAARQLRQMLDAAAGDRPRGATG